MNETCKIYYCYKATNKVNGKIYIGFATDPCTRWRNHKRDAEKGKGYAFAAAIRKHTWNAFEFEVLCCGKNKREMLEYIEPALIEQYHSSVNQNGYNILRCAMLAPCGSEKHGNTIKGHVVSQETREKISAARKGIIFSDEHRQKIGAANKGSKRSEETKQKMTAAHKGHVVTDETRMKIGAGNKGLVRSEELRNQISESLKGKTHSEETRQKMSIARKAYLAQQR